MNKKTPIQLTFGPYGHTLHHCQIISPCHEWIVYDTRNEDTQIGSTTRIERVHVKTKTIEVLYEVERPNAYGPGVGAVTYSPYAEKVLFIHGIQNCTSTQPYGPTRRTGVAIETSKPQQAIYMDARNIVAPFTKGALRGGTHSHCWHPSDDIISFTYNDDVLNALTRPNERCVGIMFPQPVQVPQDEMGENISGTYFSLLVSRIETQAQSGSDEIEKAFDECWLGHQMALAYQGWVRDAQGNRKTEIFVSRLPSTFESLTDQPIEGTIDQLPAVPNDIQQVRVTYTPKGISTLRHWLRSSRDGAYIYFLMEDDFEITQLYRVEVSTSRIEQLTYHTVSIQSPFNLSNDDQYAVYYCDNCLVKSSLYGDVVEVLVGPSSDLAGIPSFDHFDQYVLYNQYVMHENKEKYLQIFQLKL